MPRPELSVSRETGHLFKHDDLPSWAERDEDGIWIDVAVVCGPFAWGLIHQLAETFPCPPCAEKGGSLMRAAHDLVNYELGKPIHSPEDLTRWAGTYQRAVDEVTHAGDVGPQWLDHLGLDQLAVSDKPTCSAEEVAKIDRCVEEVSQDPRIDEPFALCVDAVGCKL